VLCALKLRNELGRELAIEPFAAFRGERVDERPFPESA
jgi:hypothetical protein